MRTVKIVNTGSRAIVGTHGNDDRIGELGTGSAALATAVSLRLLKRPDVPAKVK